MFMTVFLALIFGLAQGQGKFPCHGNKDVLGAHGCSSVTLPTNLCSACPLKAVADNGDFVNCGQIYDLDAAGCKSALQTYVAANPCDTKRAAQVSGWSGFDKESLDYFVYSVCEQCCDCIPLGTQEWQYESLLGQHSDADPALYKPNRGNCPAHAFYDVCKIYPNIKYMKAPGGPDHPDWPNACPLLDSWFYSGASTNWLNQNTELSFPVQRFLNNMNVANQCKAESVWKSCWDMEKKQNRL